ncbi:MAG: type II toxin-antitoxin system Phd/YefM family antitoxin [Proteobacteria bacterium]|nr:type II toxin-antitoxin system Phd/YefM family antitoxin [Pseudomonadota bacterium]
MKTINALTLRNNLGKILETLTKSGEPILLSKKNSIKAVLITPEDFKKRFLDVQAEEDKRAFLENIKKLKATKTEKKDSLQVIRELRGYTS